MAEQQTEVWKPVVGYEDRYEVSDQGRVRSKNMRLRVVINGVEATRKHKGKMLKPGRMSTGHLTVALGRGHTRPVHQLVMEAFVGVRPKNADVAHNNGDSTDNRLCNLRYASRTSNNQDFVFHGKTKLSVEQVHMVRRVANDLPKGGKKLLAAELGISPSTISDVLARRTYWHV